MASHTIELSFLLRGFSEINENPLMYASPASIIENSRENFFKAIGRYPFNVWGDDRDSMFKDEFERSFLEFFYMKDIGYQTPSAFYLELGNFLRRKMPIYCNHWRYILSEMYVTNTGDVKGNVVGNTVNDDVRNIDSWGKSVTDTETEGSSNTVGDQRAGTVDTPQNELEIDLNNLKYASQVQRSDSSSDSKTDGTSHTVTETEDHTRNVGNAVGNSTTDSQTNSFGRGKDVFDIYSQWIESGYDLFTPLFQDCMKEQIFHPLL